VLEKEKMLSGKKYIYPEYLAFSPIFKGQESRTNV
tara:strand:- start:289 stop:393 length:105 start_codon:yes stop_codon:yes gene_type:complete